MNNAQRKSAPCPERFCELISENHCACVPAENDTRRVASDQSQPFGSMPRLSSSLRNMRLIHPERLSSPSSFMARLSLSNKSASSLSCTAKRSFLLSSVDIVNLKNNNGLEMTMYTNVILKTTPRTGGAVPGRLTNNVKRAYIMATEYLNTERRPAFTWLFLATYADPEALPVTLRTQADSEEEARELVAGEYSLTFAAKIRTDCPVTCHWMEEDSGVLWSIRGRKHNPLELVRHFTMLQGGHHA